MQEGKTVVVVYQMGKVASKTIVATLNKLPSVHAFHAHVLNPENITRRQAELKRPLAARISFLLWEAIYDFVIRSTRPVKVVTLVREPIGRNISAYFQALDLYTQVRQAHLHVPLNILIDRYMRDYPHSRPLTWFDDELRIVTGIDVYAYPFPKELGYQRIQKGRFDLLIMRHDLPEEKMSKCLGDLLSVMDINIVRENLADGKAYFPCYQAFQKTIQFKSEYVDQMLDSMYVQHFFPIAELNALRVKWLPAEKRSASS